MHEQPTKTLVIDGLNGFESAKVLNSDLDLRLDISTKNPAIAHTPDVVRHYIEQGYQMIMNRKKIVQILLYTILPLTLGALIYIISRSNSIYFLNFFSLNNKKIYLPNLIKFNIVDGLLAFSISSFLNIIWDWKFEKSLIIWVVILFFIAYIFELSFGTYDRQDVLFITIGIFTPLIFTIKNHFKIN